MSAPQLVTRICPQPFLFFFFILILLACFHQEVLDWLQINKRFADIPPDKGAGTV